MPQLIGYPVNSRPTGCVYRVNSPVTEAQKNLAAFDGVCDRLLDLIYGIGRSNRLANAAGPDHLNQLA